MPSPPVHKPAIQINNAQARALWLHTNGLSKPPTGRVDIDAMIGALGFVQLDTIQNVARAHHHILWSRNQNYREPDLYNHFLTHNSLFEHFTHDASIIPMDIYPYWSQQFKRLGEMTKNYTSTQQAMKTAPPAEILHRIEREGPLSTHAFDTKLPPKHHRKSGVWHRPAHKKILDYLWYSGHLATQRREKFVKFYDLSQRVIPNAISEQEISPTEQINHLNTQAIKHLGFGTPGHIQKFWAVYNAAETKQWVEQALDTGQLRRGEYQTKNGQYKPCLVPHNIEEMISRCLKPSARLRILNPFDPLVRDRQRLLDLFGFTYRIEIFTPAANRQYGYYVYPILQSGRMVGRIDMKAHRADNQLRVKNIWWEDTTDPNPATIKALQAELRRMARFIGVDHVHGDVGF